MNIYELVFSPTGNTKKIANHVASIFNQTIKTIDLTDYTIDFSQISLAKDDICIVAIPSFGGRVPEIVATRLKKIKANNTRAILIAVYGNRAYEDTLLELQTILTDTGFCCIGAIASVARHSIMNQYASNRPNKKDLEELTQFSKELYEYIKQNKVPNNLVLPGNKPYRKYDGIFIKPKINKHCTKCQLCAIKCPVQAIDINNPTKTDLKKCISCMRCINICPNNARAINKLLLKLASFIMKKSCNERKANELFLEKLK